MRAVRQRRFGGPETLEIVERPAPVCGDGDVLVDVRAVGLNPLDWKLMGGLPRPFRWLAPRVPPDGRAVGVDMAGAVAAVGRHVQEFAPGQSVVGSASGALAERLVASPSRLTLMPPGATFEQAAGLGVAGVTALQGLRLAQVKAGSHVLINGVSGGVGTYAVQIARAWGARVTGVCSAANAELARSLGCERVIDYAAQDFTREPIVYDTLFDGVGNRTAFELRRVLRKDGVGVLVGAPGSPAGLLWFFAATLLPGVVLSRFRGPRLTAFLAKIEKTDLQALADLMRDGKLSTVIDRVFAFDNVREAMTRAASGHARGKVIVKV